MLSCHVAVSSISAWFPGLSDHKSTGLSTTLNPAYTGLCCNPYLPTMSYLILWFLQF